MAASMLPMAREKARQIFALAFWDCRVPNSLETLAADIRALLAALRSLERNCKDHTDDLQVASNLLDGLPELLKKLHGILEPWIDYAPKSSTAEEDNLSEPAFLKSQRGSLQDTRAVLSLYRLLVETLVLNSRLECNFYTIYT